GHAGFIGSEEKELRVEKSAWFVIVVPTRSEKEIQAKPFHTCTVYVSLHSLSAYLQCSSIYFYLTRKEQTHLVQLHLQYNSTLLLWHFCFQSQGGAANKL
ncbi:hypothetical protein MTR67_022821, partial [Solanum verrucosum]